MRLLAVLVLFALAAPGAMGLGLPDPPAAPAEVWLQPTLLVPRPLAVVPDGVVLALPEVPAVPRPPAVPAPTDPIPVEEERALHATLPVPSEPQRPGAPEPSAATAFPRSDPVPPAPAPVPAVFVAEVAAPPPAPARAAAAAADAGLPPADAAGAAAALGLLVLALYV
ncbi:MAG TPA: hypothetical protein VGR28_10205, partial [Candidatus Thermoplasmatota archaeon]|nr:hypothetical protein [Candidatus Thermoplasmatota archaeon]